MGILREFLRVGALGAFSPGRVFGLKYNCDLRGAEWTPRGARANTQAHHGFEPWHATRLRWHHALGQRAGSALLYFAPFSKCVDSRPS